MAEGSGRYGDVAEMALIMTGAEAVVLIVLSGVDGAGFSVAHHETAVSKMHMAKALPTLLHGVAELIAEDVANMPEEV